MPNALTIHDRQELEGERRGMAALEHSREAATLALQNRPGFDIATISEEEFAAGLQRIQLRQRRMRTILGTVLIEGVHYGSPLDRNGRPVFPKPHLKQAGAEELMQLFRLTPRHAVPPIVLSSREFVSVTVTIDLHDSAGRIVATRSGICNTMEKRFERRNGSGYTYTDAREALHDCLAMAEKRAIALAVKAATGAGAFFADEAEMEKALAAGDEPEGEPWTKDERKAVMKAAREAGLTTGDELKTVAMKELGHEKIFSGRDCEIMLAALAARKRGPTPVRVADYDPAASDAAESPAARVPEPGDADESELPL